MDEPRSVPTVRAALRPGLNPSVIAADASLMDPLLLVAALASAAFASILILGVMASRIDDSHRFVKLVVDTRRIRKNFAAPLENAMKEKAAREGGKVGKDDEFWPEPL